jgi:hypothetical protein
VALVETAVPPFAAMPNLQAGEGKRPTLAMSGFSLACLNKATCRVMMATIYRSTAMMTLK